MRLERGFVVIGAAAVLLSVAVTSWGSDLYPDDRAIKSATTKHVAKKGCRDYTITYRANVEDGTSWWGQIKIGKAIVYIDGTGPGTRHAKAFVCEPAAGFHTFHGAGRVSAVTRDGQHRGWSGDTGPILTLVRP